MSDIFISYKREDKPTAKKMAAALEERGWSVWWDPHLRAGEHFDDVIEEALEEAKCVMVLWSEKSVDSRYVRDEASFALRRQKLMPVAIEHVDPPFRFAGLHTAQLQGWDGSQASPEFIELVNDINSKLGQPDVEPAESAPPPKDIAAERPVGRTTGEWLANIVASLGLGIFYFAAVSEACSNDDILVLSALIGFPLSVFLIFQRRPVRAIWILAPIASYLIGMPYGHNYGRITESPLFGLKQGTDCQAFPAVLIVFVVLVVVAGIDHAVYRRNRRPE